ncbi:MAG: NAD(P)-binding domain-containing protein [Candidatus Colwellbacteria bacterium]|nr:NAD(P)-binding domain-containing protein [Candidatus Colwellbacteria bacterium]
MSQRVLIIGAGEIGKALSTVLKQRKDIEVEFWDKRFRSSTSESLGELVQSSQFVFLCVPSSALSKVVCDIKPYLRRKTLVVSLTKGMDKQTGKFSSELLSQCLGKRHIVILAGPMIAEELKTGAPTRATAACAKGGFRKLSQLLVGTSLRIEYSSDIRGVSIAGVLKNVYAVGFGIIDALKLGSNAKGVFTNSVVLEMEGLIRQLGGKPETAYSLAGLADLEATGHSRDSANRVAGRRIVENKKSKMTAEGLFSLEPLIKRIGGKDIPPALSAIRKTVKNPKRAREVFENFIKNA